MTSQVEIDAAEFGRHVRGGGWAQGLLVARNVDPTKKGGNTYKGPKAPSTSPDGGKVSAEAFASIAGVGSSTVIRYYTAWEAAATAGLVIPAVDVAPGDEIDFDDRHTPTSWLVHYPHELAEERLPGRVKGEGNKNLAKNVRALLADPDIKQALETEIKGTDSGTQDQPPVTTHGPGAPTIGTPNYRHVAEDYLSKMSGLVGNLGHIPLDELPGADRLWIAGQVREDIISSLDKLAERFEFDVDAGLAEIFGESE